MGNEAVEFKFKQRYKNSETLKVNVTIPEVTISSDAKNDPSVFNSSATIKDGKFKCSTEDGIYSVSTSERAIFEDIFALDGNGKDFTHADLEKLAKMRGNKKVINNYTSAQDNILYYRVNGPQNNDGKYTITVYDSYQKEERSYTITIDEHTATEIAQEKAEERKREVRYEKEQFVKQLGYEITGSFRNGIKVTFAANKDIAEVEKELGLPAGYITQENPNIENETGFIKGLLGKKITISLPYNMIKP